MIELIRFEFKKIFITKIVIITTIFLLMTNILHINYLQQNSEYHKEKPYYDALYQKVKGKIDDETYNVLNEYAKSDNDLISFSSLEIIKQLNSLLDYENKIDQIILIAKDNIKLYDNDFYYQSIINRYHNKTVSYLNNFRGWELILTDLFPILFILIIICLTNANFFTIEKENNINKFLLTTKKGIKQTIISKIISSIIFSCLIFIAFNFISLITIMFTHGLNGSLLSINHSELFRYTMFDFNFIRLFIVSGLLKLLGIIILSLITVLISSLVKKAITALILNIFIIFGSIYLFETFEKLQTIFNPISLLSCINIFDSFNVISIFNYPFTTLYLLLMVGIIEIIILFIVIIGREKNAFK